MVTCTMVIMPGLLSPLFCRLLVSPSLAATAAPGRYATCEGARQGLAYVSGRGSAQVLDVEMGCPFEAPCVVAMATRSRVRDPFARTALGILRFNYIEESILKI